MATPQEDAAGIKVEQPTQSRMRQCPKCGLAVPETIDACPNDGTQLVEKLQAGDFIFGRYEFIEVIGEGGMGVVYKARHPDLQRLYAIKLLHSHLAGVNAANRFVQEARAASSLNHQNIITIHDYAADPKGRQYIVMDYLEGQDLASHIEKNNGLPVNEVVDLFLQICDGLAHAHKKGVVHRDLKPSNIMLCGNDRDQIVPKIVDFGLAKVVSEETDGAPTPAGPALTRTGDVLGSPPYMSPEQCKGLPLDLRTDIYSLGCMMFEALTGQPPFMSTSTMALVFKHMEEPAPSLASMKPGTEFPSALEAVVAKCLEKRRADRYQSMEEVQLALEAVRHGKRIMSPSQKRWIVGGVATVCGALLVAGAVYLFSQKQTPDVHSVRQRQASLVDPTLLTETVTSHLSANGTEFAGDNLKCNDSWMPIVATYPGLRRLNLVRTSVTDKGIAALEKSSAPIADIDFENMQGIGDNSMRVMSRFPLKKVNIQLTPVSDPGIEYLSRCKSIENLQLARIAMSKKGLDAIATLPQLRVLDLTQSPELREDWLDTIAKIRTLQDLDFEGDHLGKGLSKLGPLKSLQSLRVKSITTSPNFLSYLPVMPNLKEVEASENPPPRRDVSNGDDYTQISTADLKALAAQPKLETIEFVKSAFSKPEDLVVLRKCRALKTLDLSKSNATAAGISQLKGAPALERIKIIECDIDPADVLRLRQDLAPIEIIDENEEKS